MAKRQNQDTESAERRDDAGSNPSSNEEPLRGTADDSSNGDVDVDGDRDLEDAEDLDEEDEDSEASF